MYQSHPIPFLRQDPLMWTNADQCMQIPVAPLLLQRLNFEEGDHQEPLTCRRSLGTMICIQDAMVTMAELLHGKLFVKSRFYSPISLQSNIVCFICKIFAWQIRSENKNSKENKASVIQSFISHFYILQLYVFEIGMFPSSKGNMHVTEPGSLL